MLQDAIGSSDFSRPLFYGETIGENGEICQNRQCEGGDFCGFEGVNCRFFGTVGNGVSAAKIAK